MKIKKSGNIRYDENIKKLYQKLLGDEITRRRMSNESWQHKGGKGWLLTKVLFFIAAFWALLISLFNAVISFGQIEKGAASYEKHFTYVGFIVLICSLTLLVGIILMFLKKHYLSFIISSASAFLIAASIFSLLSISNERYFSFFSVNMITFGLVIITSFILILFIKAEDREMKKAIEKTLEKLASQKGKDEFLSLDTYNDLIDNYLTLCREKEDLKNKKSY